MLKTSGDVISQSPPGPLLNVALQKPTQQSSTGWGGTSDRAVDGNTDGNYNRYLGH